MNEFAMNTSKTREYMDSYTLQCVEMENRKYPCSGKGTAYYIKDGDRFILNTSWVDNQMEGEGILYDDRRIVRAVLHFRNNLVNGDCTFFDSTGSKRFKGRLINGIRDGDYEEFDSDGVRISAGFYRKGQRHCLFRHVESEFPFWKVFSRTGMLESVSQYTASNMVQHGLSYRFQKGQVTECIYVEYGTDRYVVGRFQGNRLLQFHSNGTKLYDGGYLQDADHVFPRHGYGKEWDKDGQLIYEGPFSHGHHQWEYYVNTNGWRGIQCKAHKQRVSEFQINDKGEREGLCIDYNASGKIIRISHWKANHLQWVEYMFIPPSILTTTQGWERYWRSDYDNINNITEFNNIGEFSNTGDNSYKDDREGGCSVSWNLHGCCSCYTEEEERLMNDDNKNSDHSNSKELILIHYQIDESMLLPRMIYRGDYSDHSPIHSNPDDNPPFMPTWISYEGKGELFNPSSGQLVYEGQFHQNQRQGHGTSFSNGYRHFTGMWNGDYPNGPGCLFAPAGGKALFSGDWQWGYLYTSKGWIDYENHACFIEKVDDKRDLPRWGERSHVVKMPKKKLERLKRRERWLYRLKDYYEKCSWIYFYLISILLLLISAFLPLILPSSASSASSASPPFSFSLPSQTTSLSINLIPHKWTFLICPSYLFTWGLLLFSIVHLHKRNSLQVCALPLLPCIPFTLAIALYASLIIPLNLTDSWLWILGLSVVVFPLLVSIGVHVYTRSVCTLQAVGSLFAVINFGTLCCLPFAVLPSPSSLMLLFGLVMHGICWIASLIDIFTRWSVFLLFPVVDFAFWGILTYPHSLPVIILVGILFLIMLITSSMSVNHSYLAKFDQAIADLHSRIQEQLNQDSSLPQEVVIDMSDLEEETEIRDLPEKSLLDPLIFKKNINTL